MSFCCGHFNVVAWHMTIYSFGYLQEEVGKKFVAVGRKHLACNLALRAEVAIRLINKDHTFEIQWLAKIRMMWLYQISACKH
jgi:hypothetical protein